MFVDKPNVTCFRICQFCICACILDLIGSTTTSTTITTTTTPQTATSVNGISTTPASSTSLTSNTASVNNSRPKSEASSSQLGYTQYLSVYPAMLAQSAVMRLLSSVRPPVRLSVTIRYRVQIGLNSLKIISRPNSLRPMCSLTPNMGDLVQR